MIWTLSKSSTNTQSTKLVLICPAPLKLYYVTQESFTISPAPPIPVPNSSPQHPQPGAAFPTVLWGGVFSCNPIRKSVWNYSNARERVKIILNNDIISRAAIKQINCHAHRAKISNYPLSPSSRCWSWNCQKASRWIPTPHWFSQMPPPKREEGLNSLGA